MALFSITDAQLAFGHVALLDHTDFSLEAGERVGLIGRNGTGKSSLLKIVAGMTAPDDGLIARQSGVTSAYVPQEPVFDPDQTVAEAVAMGVPHAAGLLAEYEALVTSMGDSHDDGELHRLHALQAQLEAADAWQLHTRVDTTIAQLGLQPGARIGSLSGGLTKRVALAQALVGAPDILLLDEPTNHLDYDSIRWLEDLLLTFRGSVLFITHDRAFLDRVATRIIELDRGKLRSYPGNFTAYQTRKAQQLEAEALENARFDKLLAQEEDACGPRRASRGAGQRQAGGLARRSLRQDRRRADRRDQGLR
jgi:ATP-binding cassette subfamily F protein uup